MGKKTEEPVLHVHFLLDRSGSMAEYKPQAIQGFNDYVKGLTRAMNPASISLAVFDHAHTMVIEPVPAYQMPELTPATYKIQGGTSLFSATAHGLEYLRSVPAKQRALVILTDGQESRSHQSEITKALITQCLSEGWLVIYLGMLEEEAHHSAAHMGVPKGNTLPYRGSKIAEAMRIAAEATLRFQGAGNASEAVFTKEERASVR
jgi:hypothetical protein